MSNPETKVYIAFDLTASGGSFFALDDPVRGVLDSDYVLGGDVLVNVTNYVASASISRGKSRELDRFTAGNASVTLHNDDRTFDPFYEDSPYRSQILPRKQVVIETNGIRQFTGYIDDWDLSYELGGKSFASISCVDGFLQLSATQIDSFTNVAQLSGERIETIINRPEVAWPAGERDIDLGQETLQADVVPENTNALQYLQLVESTEPGALFMSKSGALTFRDRITVPPLVDTLIFADDGRAESVGYNNIAVIYGSENLYNRVVITREGGTPQVADNLLSQDIYGVQTLSLDGLLLTSDADSLILADYLLGRYDQPELRFSSLNVTLHDKNTADQAELLAVEIQDVIKIVFTPNGIPPAIERYGLVTGIKHTIGIDTHTVTFDFGSVQDFPIVLDDPIYGRLGGSLPLYDAITASYDDDLVRYDGQEEFGYILAF
jgi:hypothetical protein